MGMTSTAAVKPISSKQSSFSSGAKLKPTLVVPSVDLEHLTEAALVEARGLTSRALGFECDFHLIRCERIDGALTLLVAVEARGAMIGVFEATDYAGGVRLNRVCDR